MSNEQNLRPPFTPEEAREYGRKGGIASGKAKRKKASLMKCAQRVLEAEVPEKLKKGLKSIAGEVEDENDTLFTMAVAAMVKESINGNAKAFHELLAIANTLEGYITEDDTNEDELSRSLREIAAQMNDEKDLTAQ